MADVWRLADPASTRILLFDGEAVVFNPVTWETHILNDAGAAVLGALRDAPRSRHELFELLGAARDTGDETRVLRDALDRLLAELESVGLIESAGSS